MLFLTEITGFWYVISVTFGGITGGLISFFLSRNWAFEKKDERMSEQALRYIFTSGSSLLLNIGGVYVLTEYFGSHYAMSKVIVSAVVGIFFNFLMFRYFVFR